MSAGWDRARAVADAVLYEGYLLYPYRGTSSKNRSRWQFGVLGPPGAADAGLGEDDSLATQFLVESGQALTVVVRFLQLQRRQAQRQTPTGFEPADELTTPSGLWLTWDEAVECEIAFRSLRFDEFPLTLPVLAPAGTDVEPVAGGRLVRQRQEIRGELTLRAEPDGELLRISLRLANTGATASDKDDATARSMIGSHLIAEVVDGAFVSLLEPPPGAADAAARCSQHRCFPVLAGPPGAHDILLVSPIILYDHPEVAEQSSTALYDCTEIDEILTLRVMTMTDEEKAQARATDPRAAQLIDHCDAMSPEAMARLHGVLRDPHTASGLIPEIPEGVDWWDPRADNAVRPEIDAVLVNGTRVARGSRVVLRPRRNADAQDIFVAGKTARVASVHEDVEGNRHVGVVVEDDPAAELHDWYGRYLYFSPDEIEPVAEQSGAEQVERNVPWMS
ncbi:MULTISPECIES: hypothetical protein [Mycobacterium]|uniref:Uncharacterized protein n=1 Tax=Mycobacterium kiyosense TaxID=2871094 RepID=A0A9P3Q982_9MYCO|nr:MULTISPECIES: hypothetical protein [Mycobacterium]BDB43518.1 hypothetical protein IWGMT90018_39640 [Mycobacterium kiyosense]BDE13324.1 hypothetical protein MKCMC460_21840 [Mycobacterium sp. 20KCMC460]GLB85948.1 hypothetical protein SRL2020028_52040 [Mycobacterium kiyosense]GLB90852.1 hypothetical protein SRL2020130_36690 [Mycobacterium kiyosense]GLB96415.1 hypothetical protein SRL2020226_31910 [Mycobacterium kiyosense]